MSDLWTIASTDAEAEHLDRHVTAAKVASAAVWPFLAAAGSPEEFANRKALVADRIERIAAAATEGDPALFGAVHAAVQDGLDEDFTVHHSARLAEIAIRVSASREEQRRQASIREALERKTLERVLAAGLDNLGDAKADPFGEDGEPKDEEEKTAARKTAGETSTCAHCDKAIEDDDGMWRHQESGDTRCDGPDDEEGIGWGDLVRSAEPKTARKTAGENPFPPKKDANETDAGAPDPVDGASDVWTCPNCQSTDAYTQGGKDLAEALSANEPIKCGSCQQVADPAAQQEAQDPQQQAPNQAPVNPAQARRTAAEHPGGAWKAQVTGTGENVWSENALRFDTPEEAKAYIDDLSMRWMGFDMGRVVPADTPNREPVDMGDEKITHNYRTGSRRPFGREAAGNAYDATDNPYLTSGLPDELADGPRSLPTNADDSPVPATTRPRQQPMGTHETPQPVVQGFASLRTLAADGVFQPGDGVARRPSSGGDTSQKGRVVRVTDKNEAGENQVVVKWDGGGEETVRIRELVRNTDSWFTGRKTAESEWRSCTGGQYREIDGGKAEARLVDGGIVVSFPSVTKAKEALQREQFNTDSGLAVHDSPFTPKGA